MLLVLLGPKAPPGIPVQYWEQSSIYLAFGLCQIRLKRPPAEIAALAAKKNRPDLAAEKIGGVDGIRTRDLRRDRAML